MYRHLLSHLHLGFLQELDWLKMQTLHYHLCRLRPIAFETNEQLFERINELYRRALKSKLYILDENELKKSYVIDTKKFSLSKLKYAVQKLEGLSFVDGKNSLIINIKPNSMV